MSRLYFSTRALIFFTCIVFVFSCAQIVSPTGGPSDVDPPIVIRSTPPNLSTHYAGQDVRVFFNEYITLKDLNQNLLVSPPLKKNPEVRVRGKSFIMTISDTLLPNTTYNFFFGESVVDITEGNAIPNFQYVVSTGEFVDSLSVKGKLRNAFTHLPEAGAFVMMYENVYDSIPLKERPVYITKTNKEGDFQINNMREGIFLMFALRDMNSSFTYDNPTEQIAFLDSLVSPYFIKTNISQTEKDSLDLNDSVPVKIDTPLDEPVIKNNSVMLADSLAADSLFLERMADYPLFDLYMFLEKDTVQRVVSGSMAGKGKLNIAFRIPTDSVVVREYRDSLIGNWYLPEYNITKDTLTLWMPDMDRDTLRLEVRDRGNIIDSVTVSLLARPSRGRGVSREPISEEPVLNISAPAISGRAIQPYYLPFELVSQTPLRSFNNSLFELFINDSIPVESEFQVRDSVGRNIQMTNLLLADSSYFLFIHPGSITDIFGAQNDTLQYKFKLNNQEVYGSIVLNIELPDDIDKQYILQLLDESLEKVEAEQIITGSGTFTFNHLPARTYKLRLIVDDNHNGQWDTGHYLKSLQPEKVFIHSDAIQTRLNWEIEVIWNIDAN